MQHGALLHGVSQSVAWQPEPRSGNLHEGGMRSSFGPEDDGNGCYPLGADATNLNAVVASPVGNHRGDALLNEVRMLYAPVARFELLAQRQGNTFEMRLQQCQFVCRQAREQAIEWDATIRHEGFP